MQARVRYGSQDSSLLKDVQDERRRAMIVNRRTFYVKQGRMQELIELIKAEGQAEKERGGYLGSLRIYTPNIAPFGVVVVDWQYESLAEHEKGWAEWAARPTTAAFMQKWMELTEPTGLNEIWDLEEA
jgi:hypothetical protein